MQIMTPSEDKPQSFVIRLWQAGPREWRGTIRHVQSGVQRGFTQIEQTGSFIEQQIKVSTLPRAPAPFDWSGLTRRQVRLAGAMIGVIVFAFVALVVANVNPTMPLSGAAYGPAITLEELTAFLIGAGVGGLAVGVWFQGTRR